MTWADRRPRVLWPMTDRPPTLRLARPDAVALRRLARLAGGRRLTGRVRLADLDGAPVAAVALETSAVRVVLLRRGEVISDATRGPGGSS